MPAGESGTTYSHNPHNASETRHFDHPHKVMLGLYIGAFLGMLSETSMNIALPDLMDEFSVSSGTAQWMVVGCILAIGVVPTPYRASWMVPATATCSASCWWRLCWSFPSCSRAANDT